MALIMALPILIVLTVIFHASAQQLNGYAFDYSELHLSSACLNVLNTNITSCDAVLGEFAGPDLSFDPLLGDQLQLLCKDQCKTDLTALGSQLRFSCDATKDTLEVGGLLYPATYMVEKFLYVYNVACYRENSNGEFCDLITGDLRNRSVAVDECSDCMLGPQRLQLSSPLGYSEDYAEDFASITQSCGKSGYGYTTPTPLELTPTSTSEPPVATCGNVYSVGANDTCESIAAAHSVSTYSLIALNNIDFSCSVLPSTMCIPSQCTTYRWNVADTCDTVATKFNVSVDLLVSWNPLFDAGCGNADRWAFWTVCVSSPGDVVAQPPKPTAVPVPANAKSDSNKNCAQWYTVKANDTCFTILPLGSSITFAEFRVLNPSIDADCTNLWLDTAYCMQGVDPVDVPAETTFTRPPTGTTTRPPVVVPEQTQDPLAPGTKADCVKYAMFSDIDTLDPVWFNFNGSRGDNLMALNSCLYVTGAYAANMTLFLQWNPSLTEGSGCKLVKGLSYCVDDGSQQTTTTDGPSSTSAPTQTSATSTTTTSGGGPPAPTQSGVIESCKQWHVVVSGDGCWAIANQYGISLDDFYAWNPAVGTDCLNLWLNYAVCVGI